jgi:hypothetical protein
MVWAWIRSGGHMNRMWTHGQKSFPLHRALPEAILIVAIQNLHQDPVSWKSRISAIFAQFSHGMGPIFPVCLDFSTLWKKVFHSVENFLLFALPFFIIP